MKKLTLNKIPKTLADLNQWVVWKTITRDGKATKVPYQINGQPAKSNDSSTWAVFEDALGVVEDYAGIGFVFQESNGLVGVDLDGCRDPQSGTIAKWALDIIRQLDTYAEVSPSETGVKLWAKGIWKSGGKKTAVNETKIVDKEPAIEVYCTGRYFAMTGWRGKGPTEPQPRQEALDALRAKFFPDATIAEPGKTADFRSEQSVLDRARLYLAKLPPSISGQKGHDAAFHAACVLVLGFGLPEGDALRLMGEWNQLCQPAWSERELLHKIKQAAKQPGERNYLRNVTAKRWDTVTVPKYEAKPEPEKPAIKRTTIADAAARYVESLVGEKTDFFETGVPELDYALGGGLERGEMLILAGRPGHGKSAAALQMVHHMTREQHPSLFISEEMSALMLGKRTIQWVSETPQERWRDSVDDLRGDASFYKANHAKCILVESVGSIQAAVEEIDRAVTEDKVEVVVVDYAQLLAGKGNGRYEAVTNVSIELRKAASRHNILMIALAQLSRDIEKRDKFIPRPSDLKETGQLEQDADAIVFCVWPHRIAGTEPPSKYLFFISKNRNRAINQAAVECVFNPARQSIVETRKRAKDTNGYVKDFDTYNQTCDPITDNF